MRLLFLDHWPCNLANLATFDVQVLRGHKSVHVQGVELFHMGQQAVMGRCYVLTSAAWTIARAHTDCLDFVQLIVLTWTAWT